MTSDPRAVVELMLAPLGGPRQMEVVDFGGPRHWWHGPCDVEALCLGSVASAIEAVTLLSGIAGRWQLHPARVAASFASLTNLSINGVRPPGFAELSGFFQTSDGWVRVHANYPHHRERLERAVGAAGRADVERALLSLTAMEAEQVIRGARGVAAAVRSRDEWLVSDQGRANQSIPWITFKEVRDAPDALGGGWDAGGDGGNPLQGLRVLDLTRVVAGPTASRFMGALGADVLRIDPPHLPELEDHYVDSGFGKRSAVADLRTRDVVDQIHRLLCEADVLLLGYRRGSLAPAGLTPCQLGERYPNLVVVSLDAWGAAGPLRHEVGFDSIVQASTGIADDYRDRRDGAPGALPVQALDHATGYGMVAAAATLLARRARGERVGAAGLSLARTADLLYALGECDSPIEPLEPVTRQKMESVYGQLEFVPPPVDLPDGPLTYTGPPALYGSDKLAWLSG